MVKRHSTTQNEKPFAVRLHLGRTLSVSGSNRQVEMRNFSATGTTLYSGEHHYFWTTGTHISGRAVMSRSSTPTSARKRPIRSSSRCFDRRVIPPMLRGCGSRIFSAG